MPVRNRHGGLHKGTLFDTNVKSTSIDKDIFTEQTVSSSVADDDLILLLDVSEDPDVVKYMTRSNFVAGLTGSAVTVTDNESTNENNLITFVADAGTSTGTHGIEMDGDFHYNPSTGRLTATQLTGTLQTASQTNITAVGTIATGTWEGTTVAVAQGGTGATNLNNLITLATHTTGNYVGTVTAGTGLTSTGATTGENIAHSLSVDASQSQITTVGTIGSGTWEGDTITVAQGGTGATSLSNLITLATHTTGDYVQNITGGTGIDSTGATSGENIAHSLSIDLAEVGEVAIANGDYIAFMDATDSNATKKESIADVATLFAGTGLTASSSVIGVDASQTQITAVGTIATGVWQGTDVGVAYGGTGVSTLLTNAILTGNGASSIQAETDLLFSSNKLIPTASAHDAAGTTLTMSAGATTAGTSNNQAGGALTFQGGQGKGSGAGGNIIFQTANAGGSGSSINSLATAVTISDDLSVTLAGTLELGHASDTTIARSGSGDITIEGNAVYRAGGTDVAIADGGTGAGTATAGFDALSPMTAEGDVLYGGSSGTVTKLAKGSDGEYLKLASGVPTWASVSSAAVSALNNPTANELVTVGATTTELDAETNLTYASDLLTTASSSADLPRIDITNTHAGATAGKIRFNKDSASGDDNDVMGTIEWYGTDAGEATHERLAYIDSYIIDSAAGSEAAGLRFYVAENDATNTLGLQILGQADDNGEVDVTIGAGAASTTTIAGTLTMGSTAAMTNAGLVSVANQSGITGVSTITSGTWAATDVGVAHGGTGASTATAGFDALSPMSAEGDILYGGTSGTVTRLAKGSDNQTLMMNGNVPNWETAGSGITAGFAIAMAIAL